MDKTPPKFLGGFCPHFDFSLSRMREIWNISTGLLNARQCINSTGRWSNKGLEKDYYILVSLPMQHIYGARNIKKRIIIY